MLPVEYAEGATPLDPDEAEGLLPAHVTTQGELNAWEQLNIARASEWALSRRRRAANAVLTVAFAEELHHHMFDKTWAWAGTYRRTGKNLGVPASDVRVALRERLADARTWFRDDVYALDELAVRLHYQLVLVHPWPNGNGRWARLMADALLHSLRRPRFTWGRTHGSAARSEYLGALKDADRGNFRMLLMFARR